MGQKEKTERDIDRKERRLLHGCTGGQERSKEYRLMGFNDLSRLCSNAKRHPVDPCRRICLVGVFRTFAVFSVTATRF